jgi:hypothetical protein
MQTPSAWGRSCGSTARDFAPFKGDLPAIAGDGTSKSAASRRFVALSAERMAERMASDLSKLDLLVIADLQMSIVSGRKIDEHIDAHTAREANRTSRPAIPLIDRGEGSSRRYTGRPIVVVLSHGTVGSVMQEGAPSVRLVARSDRQCRDCRSTEEMRADGYANRHPCGFGNELAH